VRHSIPKPMALILNYPSNPTALVASLDFYKDVVAFARKNEIVILSDLAYSEIYFDGNPPPSVLQVPGAMDVTVEFTSMSKTFSMPGWRMGFAVGNERLIAALARVKSYLDYGAFTPIQVAATAALNGDGRGHRRGAQPSTTSAATSWSNRFGRAGWDIPPPACVDVRMGADPRAFRHLGSLEFSKLLIEHADVAVAPGVGFGEHGDDYVRLALVENEHRIRQAARSSRNFWRQGQAAEQCSSACVAAPIVDFNCLNSRGCRKWPKHFAWALPDLGTVGASVVRVLGDKAAELTRQCGRPLVAAVSARTQAQRSRHRPFSAAEWFDDPVKMAEKPTSTCFVELMGGDEGPALEAVKAALEAGRHVVTANKALLWPGMAWRWRRLPRRKGVLLNYEAAVAGGIPIIKTMREAMAGNSVSRVFGILNGTCNYILTRMEAEGLSFEECLKDAQRLGYAEADPTFDIEGNDTAHKLSILTSLAFGTKISADDIYLEGISNITQADIRAAASSATASSCSAWRSARKAASSSACIRPWCRPPPSSRRCMA
jgi:homoserine dehydrogenase